MNEARPGTRPRSRLAATVRRPMPKEDLKSRVEALERDKQAAPQAAAAPPAAAASAVAAGAPVVAPNALPEKE